jgi:hypothetical protein
MVQGNVLNERAGIVIGFWAYLVEGIPLHDQRFLIHFHVLSTFLSTLIIARKPLKIRRCAACRQWLLSRATRVEDETNTMKVAVTRRMDRVVFS